MNPQIETIDTPLLGMQNETADVVGFEEAEIVQQHRGLFEGARLLVGRAIETIGDVIPTPPCKFTAGLAAAAVSLSGSAFAGAAEAQTTGSQRALSAGTTPGLLYKSSETLSPLPHTSPAQAIADLNKQRVANGMLPVAESSAFDVFCQNYISGHLKNNFASGGVSPDTSQASTGGTVDWISGGAAVASLGQWNAKVNPWSNNPDVLDTIFDPIMTETGFAETSMKWGHGQGCIESSGDRQWAAPTFYSVPGNGSTALPWETAVASLNVGTPGSAVGIPIGAKTGTNIELWPEGIDDASVQSASLTGPNGPVGVKVVRPGMPYPPSIGGNVVSHANYVIPPKPLKPNSQYTLDANWVDSTGASHPQEVHFKTDTADAANTADNPAHTICDGCPHGHFDIKTKGDKMRVELTPAAGEKVTVTMRLGHKICLEAGVKPCPATEGFYVYDKIITDKIKQYRKPVTLNLPHRTAKDSNLLVTATVSDFTAGGYQWAPHQSIGTNMKAPK